MKFSCFCLDLNESINKVYKAIPSKPINPITEGIKMKAYNNKLILTATNLNLTIENSFNVNILEEGEILIPAKYFSEFVKKLNDGEIVISCDENQNMTIKTEDSVFNLKCMDIEEYPIIKKVENKNEFIIIGKNLKKAVESTIFSVSTDDTRPVLKGSYFKIENDILTVVAIDGYRIALYKTNIEENSGDFSFIIPGKNISEISKMIIKDDEIIKIKSDENNVVFTIGETVITSSLIDGDYIDYKQIIPNNFETVLNVEKNIFYESLEMASILTKIEKNSLVIFDINDKKLSITSNSEVGDFKKVLNISQTGRDVTVGFNAKYFCEALRNIEDEFISIKLNDKSSPCIITNVMEDNTFIYMILPIRIV